MKLSLKLLLLTSTITAMHTFAMEPTEEPTPVLTLTSIKAQLFQDVLTPRTPAQDSLDLASIHNMDSTLKITREDAQAKLAELASHLDRLKSLSSLEIYWQTPYKASGDTIKNELLPRLLAEHKARMESTTQAFTNYMAIQTLAVMEIEKKYAKEQEQKTPTLVQHQEGVNAPWQTK